MESLIPLQRALNRLRASDEALQVGLRVGKYSELRNYLSRLKASREALGGCLGRAPHTSLAAQRCRRSALLEMATAEKLKALAEERLRGLPAESFTDGVLRLD